MATAIGSSQLCDLIRRALDTQTGGPSDHTRAVRLTDALRAFPVSVATEIARDGGIVTARHGDSREQVIRETLALLTARYRARLWNYC